MSDTLRNLIKGLTASEKRNFRLYAERSGHSSNHLALFDALVKSDTQSDFELKQAWPDKMWAKNLSVSKNHLVHLLLDSLVHFHREDGSRPEMEHGIRKAVQLNEKGCKLEAIEMLRKYQEKAMADQLWVTALTAVQSRKTIQYADGIELNRSLLKQEQQCLAFIANESAYYGLIRELLNLRLQSGAVRTSEQRTRLEHLSENPLVTDVSNAITLISKYYFHTFHGILCAFSNDNLTAENHYLSALRLLRENPALAKSRAEDYFFRLNSYVSKLSAKGYTAEFDEWFLELKSSVENPVFSRLKNLKERTLVYSANHELQAYYHGKELERGCQRADALFAEVTSVFEQVEEPYRLVFLFNGMALQLMNMQFRQSLKWIIAIEGTAGQGSSVIRVIGRLCHIIVRYELKDMELLESMLRSTSRGLNAEQANSTELAVVKHYLKLLAADNTSQKELWKDFQKRLIELAQLESEKPLFAQFNFVDWYERKGKA